ncbi:hypothetical protein CONPUDRAFT_57744, partial [Coniophora puteana RWD-64-598 SS2]
MANLREESRRFRTRIPERPVSLMVTPLTDLGINHVREMQRMGISAIALDSGSLAAVRQAEGNVFRDIWKGVYQVVIVSPERLTTKAMDDVLRSRSFRKHAGAYIVDEAHVVVPWSVDFRDAYGDVTRALSRLPPRIPVLAMTATLTKALEGKLLTQLNFRRGTYTRIRRSTERTNLSMIFRTLSHGLATAEAFPQLAWIVARKQKIIVYAHTIDLCFRIALYFWSLLPLGDERYRVVRMYNSVLPAGVNEATLESYASDPGSYILVSTIKLSLGYDLRNVAGVVNVGCPTTAEALYQQGARAARAPGTKGFVMTFVEPGLVRAFQKGTLEM